LDVDGRVDEEKDRKAIAINQPPFSRHVIYSFLIILYNLNLSKDYRDSTWTGSVPRIFVTAIFTRPTRADGGFLGGNKGLIRSQSTSRCDMILNLNFLAFTYLRLTLGTFCIPFTSMFCRRACSRSLSNVGLRVIPASRFSRGYRMAATQPLSGLIITNGDLNNVSSMRAIRELKVDEAYLARSLAISDVEDDAEIREKYRPFLQSKNVTDSDWIANLELSTVLKMAEEGIEKSGQGRLKVMVLYGSMRKRYVY
jgi:hypothetical protein